MEESKRMELNFLFFFTLLLTHQEMNSFFSSKEELHPIHSLPIPVSQKKYHLRQGVRTHSTYIFFPSRSSPIIFRYSKSILHLNHDNSTCIVFFLECSLLLIYVFILSRTTRSFISDSED